MNTEDLSVRAFMGNDALATMLQALCADEYMHMIGWSMTYSEDKRWLHFRRPSSRLPAQGWKLHISASRSSAQAVLRSALPVLLTEAHSFKVTASLEHLDLLNRGDGSAGQVGKFITVYPVDDSEAVHLAAQLDEATRGLTGPNVPSDRPLRLGSRVHYRYGAFNNTMYIQTPGGAVVPAIQSPGNELIPDRRHPRYTAHAWLADPFLAAGVATELAEPLRLLGNRYVILTTLAASIHHILYLAVDLEAGRSCVIKGPGYAWMQNSSSAAIDEQLCHEAKMLKLLGPDPRIPEFFDMVEQDGDLFLVMQDVGGESLDAWMTKARKLGGYPIQKLLAWALEVAALLADIADRGIIYTDLKSANVIIGPREQVLLVDFEYACEASGEARNRGGTPGYMSPQQREGEPVTMADAIYSFGALLYFLVTGAEPSVSPHTHNLLLRPLELLHPGLSPTLQEIVTRCLAPVPADRYTSMGELQAALHTAASDLNSFPAIQQDYLDEDGEGLHACYRTLAGDLASTLCTVATPSSDGEKVYWSSNHPLASALVRRDLYMGGAGVVLALSQLAAELQQPCIPDILGRGAQWLLQSPVLNNKPLPGLYIGEAGVAAALLAAGLVLGDERLIAAADERGREVIAALPYASPDMMNGTAGRLLFHLLLREATDAPQHLQAAIACGEALLQAARAENGEMWWVMPVGYGSMSGEALLGYAHGAAGIADALLALFEASGDERFLAAAQQTAHWLQRQAVETLEDKSGLNWPLVAEKPEMANPFWCHGATGIGRFFLHLASCNVWPDASEVAGRAANMVVWAGRWQGTTQCHGLAGSIEFLLDMYRLTKDKRYYAQAMMLGRLLSTFKMEQNGLCVFPSDVPQNVAPDYMLGYAGIAVCLLRLSAPERFSHLLSRSGFRYLRQHGRALSETAGRLRR